MKHITYYCLLFTILLILSGCITNQNNTTTTTEKDVYIHAVITNDSIYPFQIISENILLIFCNIFGGLVEFDEFFGIQPDLAESWTNPDYYTWRFNLRHNVQFHNGDPFTAEDVKFSIEEVYTSYSTIIKEVIIKDNYTIDFITYNPYPGLLQLLAQNFYVLPHLYHQNPDNYWPIGTGPYQLADYAENNYTTLKRFNNYWGEQPTIKTMIFKIIENADERVAALRSGTVDSIEYNVDKNISTILQYPGIKIVEFPPLSTYLIGFDIRNNNSYSYPNGMNPTADVRVRKAIYHAIDIEPLINGPFMGLAVPATQFLTPYIFGYNSDIKRLDYNLTEAKKLLNESGYPYGFNITLDCITIGYDYNRENCELIAQQLQKIGINLTLNQLTVDTFNQKVVYEKNTSMWLVGWGTVSVDGGYVYNQFLMTEGTNGTGFLNSGHYSNPEVDQIGKKAESEMNTGIRLEFLKAGFYKALVEDVMLVPLFSQNLFILTTTNINIPLRADLRMVLKDITFTTSS
jgi:peptide/nickel transport system substrate-binding protein